MKKIKKNESGRSMVEMLGVLAIIGVLSVGGIAGYKMAMRQIAKNSFAEFLNYWGLTVEHIYSTGIVDKIPMASGNDVYLANKEIFCSLGTFPKHYCEDENKDYYLTDGKDILANNLYIYRSPFGDGISLGVWPRPAKGTLNDSERQEKIENCKEIIKIASSIFPDVEFQSPNYFSITDANGALTGCEKAPLYLYIFPFWYKEGE